MQIGDKVRFLNQSGEGIVTANLGKGQVEVAINGDFKIPFDINMLVPIAREERIVFGQAKIESAGARANKIETAQVAKAEHGVYLAFIPKADQTFELCLANNTDYPLPFSIGVEKTGQYTGLDAGLLEARNVKRYGNYAKSEMNKWPIFVIQLLFHKHGAHTLKKPLLRKIEIEPLDFQKLYKRLPLLTVDAYIYSVDDVMIAKPKAEEIKTSIANKPVITPKVIVAAKEVVDLHIEKIVSNPTEYNADEMLKLQLDVFESNLSKAIAAKLPKIIFIHGVGGYVLKKMIWLRLKSHKQVKEYKEASYSLYGNGATEVWFG